MKYLYLWMCSVKVQLFYRASMIGDMLSSLLSYFVQVCLWTALIKTGTREAVQLSDINTYILISSFVKCITRNNIATQIEDSVRDGSVLYFFIRPIEFQKYLLFEISGKNLIKTVVRILPIFVCTVFFYGIALPKSMIDVFLFIISLSIGILLMFQITFVFGLLAFWLQRTWFINWYLDSFFVFFGGTVVPLWFYPETLKNLSYVLPFRYVSFEAIDIFLGNVSIEHAWVSIGIAAAWYLCFYGIGKLIWKFVNLKIDINGG